MFTTPTQNPQDPKPVTCVLRFQQKLCVYYRIIFNNHQKCHIGVAMILWMEEILHHLGWLKPYISWCRISSIHRISLVSLSISGTFLPRAAPGSSVAFCKPCSKGLICLSGTQAGDGHMGMVWGYQWIPVW